MDGFWNWGNKADGTSVGVSKVVAVSQVASDTGKSEAALAQVPSGLLVPTEVNGEACFVGTVQFAHPRQLRQLLNPFVQVRDTAGNRFRVRGLLGHVIAVESAKRQQPAGVVCVKKAENEFEVVRWF